MRINKLFLIVSILSFSLHSNAQKAWGVLASPIKLNVDTTQIFLSDYFPYGDNIDSISTNTALTIKRISKNEVLLIGNLPVKLSNIRFFTKDDKYDIPLIASEKENVQLNIQLAKAVSNLSIKGSFSNWTVIDSDIEAIGALPSKVWTINLKKINSGRHEYKLIGDGVELDPVNSAIVSNGIGGTNAVLEIGKKSDKQVTIRTNNFEGDKVSIETENIEGYYVYWNHQLVQSSNKKVSKIQFNIPAQALKVKRTHIRVYAYGAGKLSNDLLIPLEYGRVINTSSLIERTDLHSQIMYFMMVDRFMNGDKSNDAVFLEGVNYKANFLGGDIAGLEQKIKSGYFSDLGFNTLWLSPIAKNPSGAWGYWNKGLTTKFSAYHGYWPTSYSLVDNRFGTNEGFKKMINEAHNKDINVVLDFVAHHIHTDHPLYKQHPDWVTTLNLPDGTLNTERWDEYRLTTWFDTFLPTLDFAKPEVNSTISDSVMFWVRNFDIDGFRHDASKHVPEIFWRTLTQKIRNERNKNGKTFYQIGETYGSNELIGSYVNSGQMDAQFDFNLYDASIAAFAFDAKDDKKDFDGLKTAIEQSFHYYGHHHLMGNISGNQDKPRFISLAEGTVRSDEDTKLAGWTRDIQHQGEHGFQRLAQLHAFNFSMPGIPVVYYGDEIGLPGANDPDNRRLMKFENLSVDELTLKEIVQQLASIRNNNLEMIYGDFKILNSSDGSLAFERTYFGKKSIIVFSKSAAKVKIKTKESRISKTYFNHSVKQVQEDLILDMSNNDFEIIRYE